MNGLRPTSRTRGAKRDDKLEARKGEHGES